MPYFIETVDRPGSSAIRAEHRQRHLDYLNAEVARLLACGPKLDGEDGAPIGGVYLLDVETREEAEAFIRADPFSEAGLFESVRVLPWRRSFLDGRSFAS